ncbi:PAS domain S-box protein [candidate division KSB1 bacterium]|nr:PAS domain S-box protein [candidate division KSB1 bacterium]
MKAYYYPKQPLQRRSYLDHKIIITLFVILGLLLILFAVLEIKGSKNELLHVMHEQSTAMMTALQKGSENAMTSFALVEDLLAEKLLSNARLLERLDYIKSLSEKDIKEIAEQNNIFRINVFDAAGNRILTNAPGRGGKDRMDQPFRIHEILKDETVDELVLGFRQSRFGTGDRFAVAKRRRKGGVIIMNINAAEMLAFRKTIGAGKLVTDIGNSDGIEYVVLQDSVGILLASQGVDSIRSIRDDAFLSRALGSNLSQTRITSFKDHHVYEVVQSVSFDSSAQEILRIGLGTQHLQESESHARTRTILASFAFLVIGVFVTNWFIGNQNYKTLQDTLNRMETYTGSILANMTEAVIAMDYSEKITLFNNAAEKLFQLKTETVLGKNCSEMLSPFCKLFDKSKLNHKDDFRPNVKLKINNKEKIVSIGIKVIKNGPEEEDIIFVVIKDITEQKKLEENLSRKDQITAMGYLASGVAHEIRNPLNAISIISQRFKNEFAPQTDRDEYLQLATTVVNESKRINHIIQQFLQFAKPEKLIKTKVNLMHLINDVIIVSKQKAEQKAVIIKQKCENVPALVADGDKLKQALLNLVQNGIDACAAGQYVEINCFADAKYIHIHIIDNGKGIPEKNLDKIFNLYFTTREEGTGLGLSIVQQIITLHNGTIQVKSKPGKGTTFQIQIPIEE